MVIAQFLATAVATLIGVGIAFRLDRIAEEKAEKEAVLQRAKAIQNELQGNQDILEEHKTVIDHFARSDGNDRSDHYTLRSLSTQSMSGLEHHHLIKYLSDSVYGELQEVYLETENLNRTLERLRLEMLHTNIGEEDDSPYPFVNWTIVVGYYDQSDEEVDQLGLGPLIGREGRDLRTKMRDLNEELDSEIKSLRDEVRRPLYKKLWPNFRSD